MSNGSTYPRVDANRLEVIREAERPPVPLRWWLVIPLGILLAVAQAWLNLTFEFSTGASSATTLISSQIPIITFAFSFILLVFVNRALRLWWPLGLLAAASLLRMALDLLPWLGWDPETSHGIINVLVVAGGGLAALAAAISGIAMWMDDSPRKSLAAILAACFLAIWSAIEALSAASLIGALPALKSLARMFDLSGPMSNFFILGWVPSGLMLLIAVMLVTQRRRSWTRWLVYLIFVLLPVLLGLCADTNGGDKLRFFAGPLSLAIFPIFAYLVAFSVVREGETGKTRTLFTPFNRGELMAFFAAMFVSGGISSFGLIDQLVPMIIAPYNPTFNTRQSQWDTYITPHLNRHLFITDTDAIRTIRQGMPDEPNLWRKIPWMLWLKPLALWSILIFGIYMMYYALAMLLYPSWARREKLIFPLARLPEDLVEDPGAAPGTLPSTFKSSFFWAGLGIVVLILAYNACVQGGWIRLQPLYLGVQQEQLMKALEDTPFRGIADNAFMHFTLYFIFIAVGIAYLLPLEISFSMWSYSLVALGMIMMGIWTAAGASTRSFSSDWLWENSFVSAMGAGGMLVFASTYVLKAIYERWVFAREWGDKDAQNGIVPFAWRFIVAFGWGGALLLTALIIIIGWMVWSGVPFHWAVLFIAVLMLTTIGLMRVVAEGGVYWIQIHTGPFHLARMAGLAGSADPSTINAVATLMPMSYATTLETKDLLAPAALNSMNMQDETRASKRTFHLTVILAIVATMIASAIVILTLGYERGVDRGGRWFWTNGPQYPFQQAVRFITGAGLKDASWLWWLYGIGGAWVAFSFLMRRRFFWWMHPIGFAMIANPLASNLWLSFFLGWLCKKLTVKYGGRHTYAKVRPFFIGMILGEVLSAFFWSCVSNIFEINIRVDINRYGPYPY